MNILAIETSCDETAVAVIKDGREILSNVIASQVEEHSLYGGVVPEIASRRHIESISGVYKKALLESSLTKEDIDAVAVTYTPGLIGALLVGVNFAKGLAMAIDVPVIPVHHIRGHIAANYLSFCELAPPFLALVVSGGHSHIIEVVDYTDFHVIGRTYDDAAGEAYDKAARTMGLSYPGGVYIDRASKLGETGNYKLPTPKVGDSLYDFSFSGLKTAVINIVHNAQQKGETIDKNNLAADFNKKVVSILKDRTILAAKNLSYKNIVLAGGVSANSLLREEFLKAESDGFKIYYPPLELCGDNAAMIGAQAFYEYKAGNIGGMDLNGYASMPVDNITF